MAEYLSIALIWVSEFGFAGYLFFIGLYVVSTVCLLPASVLTVGAGAVYGVGLGFVLVSAGSTLGAAAAFIVGRYLARGWAESIISKNYKFTAIDEAVGREGWKIVLLTRLSPLFPFNFLNYAFGLTKISFPHYVSTSWVGMMPGALMYVYLGALTGELVRTGAGSSQRSLIEWVFYVIGLIATIAVAIYIARIAKYALSEKTENLD